MKIHHRSLTCQQKVYLHHPVLMRVTPALPVTARGSCQRMTTLLYSSCHLFGNDSFSLHHRRNLSYDQDSSDSDEFDEGIRNKKQSGRPRRRIKRTTSGDTKSTNKTKKYEDISSTHFPSMICPSDVWSDETKDESDTTGSKRKQFPSVFLNQENLIYRVKISVTLGQIVVNKGRY